MTLDCQEPLLQEHHALPLRRPSSPTPSSRSAAASGAGASVSVFAALPPCAGIPKKGVDFINRGLPLLVKKLAVRALPGEVSTMEAEN